MSKNDKDLSKLVKDQKTKPCGCVVVTMSDDKQQVTPCPPCGLMAAANALLEAGQALGAVGQRLRVEHNQAVTQAAVQAVARKQQ